MEDEAFLGSDKEDWLCVYLIFRFGECFSIFFVVDVEKNCENLYLFGSMLYVLLSSAYIFQHQPLEFVNKVSIKLQGILNVADFVCMLERYNLFCEPWKRGWGVLWWSWLIKMTNHPLSLGGVMWDVECHMMLSNCIKIEGMWAVYGTTHIFVALIKACSQLEGVSSDAIIVSLGFKLAMA